jgi:ABC-type sugar transport system ATPase subunit
MCLVQKPKLLLLDEPTAGMARADTNNTIDLLKQISEARHHHRIIEHDMHVVFSLAQRITVLAQGTPLVEDTPDNIKGHPKVREAYLGRERHNEEGQRDEVKPDFSKGNELRRNRPGLPLGLGDASYYGESYIVQGVSFNVHEGEILALAGPQRRGQDHHAALHRADGQPPGEPWRDLARPQAAAQDEQSTRPRQAGIGSWCRKTAASSPA